MKDTVFSETLPTKEELDNMIQEKRAIRAYVTEGKVYLPEETIN